MVQRVKIRIFVVSASTFDWIVLKAWSTPLIILSLIIYNFIALPWVVKILGLSSSAPIEFRLLNLLIYTTKINKFIN